jgi:hypothetical protein
VNPQAKITSLLKISKLESVFEIIDSEDKVLPPPETSKSTEKKKQAK